MNTAQEPATNTVPPFPFFVENPVDLHPNELPANKNNINSEPLKSQISDLPSPDAPPAFAASAYHFPPGRYSPQAHSCQRDDFRSVAIDTTPLPDRCQFFFSDGRQCTMARSDIHPSLCRFHAEREEQLFGDPVPGGNVVGASLDLPELYSACGDLTTAAGVNRALGQVFRLLAQRRISRQEAATFGHLAQLLLRTISAARAEFVPPIRPSGESHHLPRKGYQQDALFAGNKVELSPANKVVPSESAFADESRRAVYVREGFVGDLSVCLPSSSSHGGDEPATPNPAGARPAQTMSETLRFPKNGDGTRDPSNPADHPQNQHLRKNSSATRAKSTLAKLHDLKPLGINT